MFGNLILSIKKNWKQFWCIHNYVTCTKSIMIGNSGCYEYCSKCKKPL